MKKKVYLSRLLKLGSLFLAVLLCVLVLQDLLFIHADHNRERVKGFYLEPENSLDVVIIGSSEVYSDFSSARAYKKYGFTSYPYATQASSIYNYKTMLKETLRTQNPKLIVVEINGALMKDKRLLDESSFNTYVDNLPFNDNKREVVRGFSPENEIEHYVPIIKYHDVWKNFPLGLKWDNSIIQDYFRGHNLLKGAKTKTKVFTPERTLHNESMIWSSRPLDDETNAVFTEFLDYCRDNKINNILFVRFPHLISEYNYSRAERSNSVRRLVESYGYKYVSFYSDIPEMELDSSWDYYNLEHLNIYGQSKFTDYFGQYLVSRYNLTPTALSAENKAQWDEAVRYYDAFRNCAEYLTDNGVVEELGENFNSMIWINKFLDKTEG